MRAYSPAHVCACVHSAGTFGTGHVEEPKAFRPGEAEQRNGADAQLEHLPWPCRAVRVQVGAPVGAGVRLPFCRRRVGRRAYDVEGLSGNRP